MHKCAESGSVILISLSTSETLKIDFFILIRFMSDSVLCDFFEIWVEFLVREKILFEESFDRGLEKSDKQEDVNEVSKSKLATSGTVTVIGSGVLFLRQLCLVGPLKVGSVTFKSYLLRRRTF